jgi:hypothetical protein
LVKPIENRFKFEFQTFGRSKPVSTGKLVVITDKPVNIAGLLIPKSINRYKFNFLKKSLKIRKNTKKTRENSKRSNKESFSNLHHLIG